MAGILTRSLAPLLIVAGCASAEPGITGDGGSSGSDGSGSGSADASCGTMCDEDNDGVFDGSDMCPATPSGAPVNGAGCADSQVMPMLEPDFPPFGLTWTPTGDLGRPGGLTWTYAGIERADLFHIYWIVCDDPNTPCGVSLDGPIDVGERWQFSATDSDLINGRLVFTNATRILLNDTSTPALTGRLTLTIVNQNDMPMSFYSIASMGVTARMGTHGAEITGTGYKVVAIIEVQDATLVWTPFLTYYDAAPTPTTGGGAYVSFGGSFYSE
ncbi:MAG: hypothetical protein ACKV2T_23745 [Kofleriaceae bacterium]